MMRIQKALFVSALILAATANTGAAQSRKAAAKRALDGVPEASDIITQQNANDVVTPLEPGLPPEADLTSADIDGAIQDELVSGSVAADAYEATESSVIHRPSVDIDPDTLTLTETALDVADDLAGGNFSSSGSIGECVANFTPSGRVGTYFCRKSVEKRLESCEEQRVVSVDRDDEWSCSSQPYQTCTNDVLSYSCTGNNGLSCKQQAINVSPSEAWRSTDHTFTLRAAAFSKPNQCVVRKRVFTMNIKDFSKFSSIDFMSSSGVKPHLWRINGALYYRNMFGSWRIPKGGYSNLRVEKTSTHRSIAFTRGGQRFEVAICALGMTHSGTAGAASDAGVIDIRDDHPNIAADTLSTTSVVNNIHVVDAGADKASFTIELWYLQGKNQSAPISYHRFKPTGSCCTEISAEGNQSCN